MTEFGRDSRSCPWFRFVLFHHMFEQAIPLLFHFYTNFSWLRLFLSAIVYIGCEDRSRPRVRYPASTFNKFNCLTKIIINRNTKPKRHPVLPCRAHSSARKSIGANPNTPNIANYASTIRIRWVKKMFGEKFRVDQKSSRPMFYVFAIHRPASRPGSEK